MTRVRFAPSPTGNLHIGTLRTAIFAWLFAKQQQGAFILRIEDTDLQRSKPEYEATIFEGLKWVGIHSDEGPEEGGDFGPYRQSERSAQGLYKKYADQLLEKGAAYYCFCTEDELKAEREDAISEGKPYVYVGKYREFPLEEALKKAEAGEPYSIRYKLPKEGEITYCDDIRGEVTFDLSLIGDFVILKSDGSPSYNFAVVIDDMLMNITHVIRGEDHISNMPRQLCLFDEFGVEKPKYAHLPMILGPDKSKLSKRHGATNIMAYRDEGFLPQAFFNFLTLLGWSSGSEKEIFSKEELKTLFSLDRVSKSNAIFDLVKLTWMNGQYIRQCDRETIFEQIQPYLDAFTKKGFESFTKDAFKDAIVSVQGNLEKLSDINQYLAVYIQSEDIFEAQFSDLVFNDQEVTVIQAFRSHVEQASLFSKESVLSILDALVEELQLGKGKLFKPIRLAVSAEKSGPNIAELLSIFGKEKVLSRLKRYA